MNSRLDFRQVTDERVFDFLRTQKSVVNWIETVLNIPNSIKENFLATLKNGIILCYVMNEIEENSIPRIQENRNHEFKLKENVVFFLEALKDYGVPKNRIFHLHDLWEEKSVVNVVECLVYLAQTAEKKGFLIPLQPIPNEGEFSNSNLSKKISQKEMFLLKTQLVKLRDPSEQKKNKISEQILRKKLALLVGNNSDFVKYEKGFVAFQALYRGYAVRKVYRKKARDQAFRDKVAKEILSSERDYVRNLEVCINFYYKPLKEGKKKLLEPEKVREIFSDIELIYSLNQNLLANLEPIVNNWSPTQCLGPIFLKIMQFLKIYTTYIQNYDRAIETLAKSTKKSSTFSKFLNECYERPEVNHLPLQAYLIMPVQRIPRYSLLLKEITKHTWEGHSDYKSLCEASNQMSEITSYLNEKKREAENYFALVQIQERLIIKKGLYLPSRSRILIKEGVLTESDLGLVHVYLCSDVLVIGKKELASKKIRCKACIKTSNLILDDAYPEKIKFGLKKKGSKKFHLRLAPKNMSEKAQWISGFEKAISEQIKSATDNQKDTAKSQQEYILSDFESDFEENKSPEDKLMQRKMHGRHRSCDLSRTTSINLGSFNYESPVHSRTSSPVPTRFQIIEKKKEMAKKRMSSAH